MEHDEDNPSAFIYQRNYLGTSLTVTPNLTAEQVNANLPSSAAGGSVLISNYADPPFIAEEIDLRPFEAVVWLMK